MTQCASWFTKAGAVTNDGEDAPDAPSSAVSGGLPGHLTQSRSSHTQINADTVLYNLGNRCGVYRQGLASPKAFQIIRKRLQLTFLTLSKGAGSLQALGAFESAY